MRVNLFYVYTTAQSRAKLWPVKLILAPTPAVTLAATLSKAVIMLLL